jgi:NAD(P)-dependent dehydrogenase (short-subunit alcohol dehydrogenase family)
LKAHDLFNLAGKVALVTGASSGLGLHFSTVLAENGASVALVARRQDRLAGLAAQIEKSGGRAVAVRADVCDRVDMIRAFNAVEKTFGIVDILVNNAGVVHAHRLVDLPEQEWRRVLATDLDAVFFWSQEAARRMLAAGKAGAIVNISSVAGFNVSKGVAAYAVAKAGVIQLTKALGLELAAKGIRANAIAPGWIATDLNRDYLASERGAAIKRDIPLGRFGEQRDLAGALLLLVSDAGRYMTGATIVIDGGQLVAMRS